MNTTSKIVLGILGAAAAGAVIGMLVAPERGEDLRNRIAGNARDWAGELADWLNARKKDLNRMSDGIAAKAEGFADEAADEWKRTKKAMS